MLVITGLWYMIHCVMTAQPPRLISKTRSTETPTIPLGVAPPRTYRPQQAHAQALARPPEHKLLVLHRPSSYPNARMLVLARHVGRFAIKPPQISDPSLRRPLVRQTTSPLQQNARDRVTKELDGIDNILDRPFTHSWDCVTLIKSLIKLRLWRAVSTAAQRFAFDEIYGLRLGLIRSEVETRFAYLKSFLP
jgi:hypothetical protein